MRFCLFATLLSLFLIANSAVIFAQAENATFADNSTVIVQALEVNATLNKEKFLPGDRIKITGVARLDDGSDPSGTVRIKVDQDYTVSMKDGQFSLDISLSDNIESGDHTIVIDVRDEDGNIGSTRKQIYVLPLPKRLDVYLNNNSFLPGTSIEASAVMRDQNGEPIDAATIITVYDSRGAEIVKAVIHDETFLFELPRDAQPGDWWVYAYSEPMKTRRFFKVEESSKIETSINGSTLIVENMGNVPYQGSVSISFLEGESKMTETVGLNLAVGAKTKVMLKGLGEYGIKVSSTEGEKYFDKVSLTGGAIGARAQGDNSQLIIALVVFFSALIAFSLALKIKIRGKYKNGSA